MAKAEEEEAAAASLNGGGQGDGSDSGGAECEKRPPPRIKHHADETWQSDLLLPAPQKSAFAAPSSQRRRALAAIGVLCCACLSLYGSLSALSFFRSQMGEGSLTGGRLDVKRTRRVQIGEDCDAPDTKCVYFRPKPFVQRWDDEHQNDVQPRANHSACYMNLKKYNNFTCKETASFNHSLRDEARCHPRIGDRSLDLPRDFTVYHVFKTGGIAFDRAMSDLGATQLQNCCNEQHIMKRGKSHAQFIEHAQQRNNRDDGTTLGGGHPALAVVRDPVSRFVSAVRQVMEMGRLGPCRTNSTLASDRLQCAFGMVVRGETQWNPVYGKREPHLESQVGDLHCKTDAPRTDVALSVYSFEDLPGILEALGANGTQKVNAGEEKTTTMSVSDMDADLIEQICRFYAIDVAMVRSLGFSAPYCK